jgi:hypothetical protein
MSDRKIIKIIRRHTGPNPAEIGMWPHAEIKEMIAATRDGDGITAQERSDLLYVVGAFGGSFIHPKSDLYPEDKEALKNAALRGIETARQFQSLSPWEQTAFVKLCVLQTLADSIGFSQAVLQTADVPPKVSGVADRAANEALERAGRDKYQPTPDSFVVYARLRNNKTYGYLFVCSFEANNRSGEWWTTAMVGGRGDFSRTIYEGFNRYDPGGDEG